MLLNPFHVSRKMKRLILFSYATIWCKGAYVLDRICEPFLTVTHFSGSVEFLQESFQHVKLQMLNRLS